MDRLKYIDPKSNGSSFFGRDACGVVNAWSFFGRHSAVAFCHEMKDRRDSLNDCSMIMMINMMMNPKY